VAVEAAFAFVRPEMPFRRGRENWGIAMSTKNLPTRDRAANARAEIERIFANSLREFFDHVEDIIREAITEHEIDVRSEAADEK
jgi:hypothetical protein